MTFLTGNAWRVAILRKQMHLLIRNQSSRESPGFAHNPFVAQSARFPHINTKGVTVFWIQERAWEKPRKASLHATNELAKFHFPVLTHSRSSPFHYIRKVRLFVCFRFCEGKAFVITGLLVPIISLIWTVCLRSSNSWPLASV